MSKFNHFPSKPSNSILWSSYYILIGAHQASSSFLDIFETTRQNRQAKGTPTDQEQNLLRAMLIFASSGLDSMVKQLVKDSLDNVIIQDEGAHRLFESHIEKRIKKLGELDAKFLAKILTNGNPKSYLISDLKDSICSSSLQSKDQLLKVMSNFNIPTIEITNDFSKLEEIFKIRNQIAHEMDVDFNQPNRSLRPRQKQMMIDYTNEIFRIANSFLVGVEKKFITS